MADMLIILLAVFDLSVPEILGLELKKKLVIKPIRLPVNAYHN